jgi:DNA-binding CsgD family transcriptional regulator
MYEWVNELAARFRLILYDGRGQGMSGRDLSTEYSFDAMRLDLEAVLAALELERSVLIGSHASGHTAVRFAVAHPQRVAALVLVACSASGDAWPVINAAEIAATNWPYFLAMYSSLATYSTPFAEKPLVERTNFLNQCVRQPDWVIMARKWMTSDITAELSILRVPTLALHPLNYINMPVQAAQEFAARVAHARLTLIEGSWSFGNAAAGARAIESFLTEMESDNRPVITSAITVGGAGLSSRELEVLRLLAAGRSNQQIADELVISLNTVRRHVSNIFNKTGAANRAQATAYAKDLGLA